MLTHSGCDLFSRHRLRRSHRQLQHLAQRR
jgi:hypothetical protein